MGTDEKTYYYAVDEANKLIYEYYLSAAEATPQLYNCYPYEELGYSTPYELTNDGWITIYTCEEDD